METLEQYRGWVMDRLPCILDPVDFDCVFTTVEECFNEQFTKEDALRYVGLTEHANPHMEEHLACRRMAAIARKYPSRHPSKPLATIDDVIEELEIQVLMKQEEKQGLSIDERQDICGQIVMARKAIMLLKNLIIEQQILATYKPTRNNA